MSFRRRAFGSGGFSTDNRNTFGRVRIPKRRVASQRSPRSQVAESLEPSGRPRERALGRASNARRVSPGQPPSVLRRPRYRPRAVLAICVGRERAQVLCRRSDIDELRRIESPAGFRVSMVADWKGEVRVYAGSGREWTEMREKVLKPLSRQRRGGRVSMTLLPRGC